MLSVGGGQPRSALEHRVQGWATDLRQLCDLLLRHARVDGLAGELRDGLRLGGGSCARTGAVRSVGRQGSAKVVHAASVKYLTRDGKRRNVLYMATSIPVSADVLDRAIQALDTASYFGVAGYEPSDEDRAQLRASYDELVALAVEHSEIEEEDE